MTNSFSIDISSVASKQICHGGEKKGEKAALTTTASRVYFAQLFKVSSQAALKMTHTLVNTEKIKTHFLGQTVIFTDVLISNLEFFTKLTNAFFFLDEIRNAT